MAIGMRRLDRAVLLQAEDNRFSRIQDLTRRNRAALRLLHEAAQAISDDEPELAERLMRQARRALSSWWPARAFGLAPRR
jgi:hypothetical protein